MSHKEEKLKHETPKEQRQRKFMERRLMESDEAAADYEQTLDPRQRPEWRKEK